MNPALVIILSLMVAVPALGGQVSAKAGVADEWKTFPVRTLADLPVVGTNSPDAELDRFGGHLWRTVPASGFFSVTNLAGRWWLVEPDGGCWLDKGVSD